MDNGGPSDVHALIVSASQYFHNYRHLSNALLVRDAIMRTSGGAAAADANIVLMLAGSMPCDPRNARGGSIRATSGSTGTELYPRGLQVDYRGDEVSLEAVMGVLTDRMVASSSSSSPSSSRLIPRPAHKRLRSGPNSRLLLYLTGHGGDEFLKFGDQFELTASELAVAIRQTFALGRCRELLLLVDTCQASTLGAQLPLLPPLFGETPTESLKNEEATDDKATASRRPKASPTLPGMRVVTLASSRRGENSYSYDTDRETLGVALSDRFTFHVHSFVTRAPPESATLAGLQSYLARAHLMSNPVSSEIGWSDGRQTSDGQLPQGKAAGGRRPPTRPLRSFFAADPPASRVIEPPARRALPSEARSGAARTEPAGASEQQRARHRKQRSPRACEVHVRSQGGSVSAPARLPTARWRQLEAALLWGGHPPPAPTMPGRTIAAAAAVPPSTPESWLLWVTAGVLCAIVVYASSCTRVVLAVTGHGHARKYRTS